MDVEELLSSTGSLIAIAVLVAVLGWGLYQLFGPQVLGVPAMVGVLVIAAVWSAFSSAAVVLAMVAGLLILMLVIGMAMSLGPERPPEPPEGESRLSDLE